LGIEIHTLMKDDKYLEVIRNPKFGYGKNLNPCIDCRIYILEKAKELGKEIGADFIFTGEVLNQRPKSQNLKALRIIEVESGLSGNLLRPLSALHLEPTILETKGLIDRSKLLDIRGRSRKRQLEIARKHGLLQNYTACGGCLLTDKSFANRMRDYLKFTDELKMEDIPILKYGRHFRYKTTKIIVGRNEVENNLLIQLKKDDDLLMEAKDVSGPITIIQNPAEENAIKFAAMLTLRYSDYEGSVGDFVFGKTLEALNNLRISEKANETMIQTYIL
ncbi:hypothetical protein LCGC14_1327090, partial [marine sediment metagenome]